MLMPQQKRPTPPQRQSCGVPIQCKLLSGLVETGALETHPLTPTAVPLEPFDGLINKVQGCGIFHGCPHLGAVQSCGHFCVDLKIQGDLCARKHGQLLDDGFPTILLCPGPGTVCLEHHGSPETVRAGLCRRLGPCPCTDRGGLAYRAKACPPGHTT